MKTYNVEDVNLVLEWIGKYFESNALINKVFGGENRESHSSTLSFENEYEYQRLRFWFRKNHDKFVPIWVDFCSTHGKSTELTAIRNEVEYRKNPFLYYYYPDDLRDLVDQMGDTIVIDSCDLNKPAIELILNVINRFSCTVIHLSWWIGEFADPSVQYPFLWAQEHG
jgi:hypothetical protein